MTFIQTVVLIMVFRLLELTVARLSGYVRHNKEQG